MNNRVNGLNTVAVFAVAACVGLGGCGRSGDIRTSDSSEGSDGRSKDKQVVTVRSRDIPDKVRVLGIFGRPLGSLITIRGKWVGPGLRKDPALRFQVTEVNGRAPEEKIELRNGPHIRQVFPDRKGRGAKPGEAWNWKYEFRGSVPSPTPTEGETWEMLGVEVGCFDYCYSEEARREIGWTKLDQEPSEARPFYTCFEYIAVRIVRR
jgi:hypothetical protein